MSWRGGSHLILQSGCEDVIIKVGRISLFETADGPMEEEM